MKDIVGQASSPWILHTLCLFQRQPSWTAEQPELQHCKSSA